jgi:ribosomal protein L12E/L44/L45/RPP1/RPP2
LTNAAGVEIEAIWATLLAKALEGKDVKELLSNVGSGGGAPATGAPAASGAPAAAAAVEEKEEPKSEEKEESDDDMVRACPFHPSSFAHLLTICKLFHSGLRIIRLSIGLLMYPTSTITFACTSLPSPPKYADTGSTLLLEWWTLCHQ